MIEQRHASIRTRWRARLWLLPFALVALAVLLMPAPPPATSAVYHVDLEATQFAFEPGRLEVQQGDRVVINLTAADVVHGFYLDGYNLTTRVTPGVAQRIEFVADRPGKFRYRCSVSCGPLHPFMIGELVVRPNSPLWRAVALVFTGLTGMLVYLWYSGQQAERSQV